MFPFRLYPWLRPEMLDLRTNPEYMRGDFIEKDLHLHPPLCRWAAWGLARLVVPLLSGIGSIAAFQSDQVMEKSITLRQSQTYLGQGRSLLIFPEVPTWEPDPATQVRHLSRGVLWLAVLFHRKTGNRLPIFPVCTHPSHRIRLGSTVMLGEDEIASSAPKQAWIEKLEDRIRGMYLDMEKELQRGPQVLK